MEMLLDTVAGPRLSWQGLRIFTLRSAGRRASPTILQPSSLLFVVEASPGLVLDYRHTDLPNLYKALAEDAMSHLTLFSSDAALSPPGTTLADALVFSHRMG